MIVWAVALVFGFSLLGLTVGAHFSMRIKVRRKYFEDCISLINSLEGEVRFKQSKLTEILLCESERFGAELKDNIHDFIRFISKKSDAFAPKLAHLTKRERSIITDMFSVLGTYDTDTQVMVLENFKGKIDELYNSEKQRESKYCSSYIKLGVLVGAAIGILVL